MTTLLHTHSHQFDLSFHSIGELLIDTATHTVSMLPFLFLAFLIIEFLEHKAQDKIKHLFTRAEATGPAVATFLGCFPQCGFSVMSANLYSSGVISLGTLIAVFLSTSDEAIILLANAENGGFEILRLLITKICIAVFFGYGIYFIEKKLQKPHRSHHHHELCEHDHCGCEKDGGTLRPALIHTFKVFGFLFLFTLIINLFVGILGMEAFSRLLLSNSAFQPLVSALLGFIPNCASSILLTQLYINGSLSFGSLIAGLCTNAGAGLLVLFRNRSKTKENIKIAGILYLCAIIPSMILHLIL